LNHNSRENMLLTSIRFSYAKQDIFTEPLYYIGSNIKQAMLGTAADEKLVDSKLTQLEMPLTTHLEVISLDIDNELTINYLLDRLHLENGYEFTYNGVEMTIENDDKIKQEIVKIGHNEQNVYSAYKITFPSESVATFEAFIKTSVEYYKKYYHSIKTEKNKIKLFISSSNGDYFDRLGSRNPRSLDSIYLPQKDKTAIVNDLAKFLDPKTEQWYADKGIPYKRIYLFAGIPGAGKSSLIGALASHFGYNLGIVSFSPKMTDVSLLRAFRSLSDDNENKEYNEKKIFFVLEDMDCIFNKNRSSSEELHCSLTFSGILNALDGITGSNKIGFISTNHIEELNKALIRPGRVDYVMTFDYAIKEQIIMMFDTFTENKDKEVSTEFYKGVCGLNIKVSTSLLQQYLMKYYTNSRETIDNLSDLKKMYESTNVQKEADETGMFQ
jgi:hypothetical protein